MSVLTLFYAHILLLTHEGISLIIYLTFSKNATELGQYPLRASRPKLHSNICLESNAIA